MQNIKEDINLLLENAGYEPGLGFEIDGFKAEHSREIEDISGESGNTRVIHSQALDLGKLYHQQNKKDQIAIKDYLLQRIASGGEISKTVVITLFQLGYLKDVIDEIQRTFTRSDQKGVSSTFLTINNFLFYCWRDLNKSQIKTIRAYCFEITTKQNELGDDLVYGYGSRHAINAIIRAIIQQTNKILVKDVRARIELGYNPEINEDEQKLKDEFGKFGFPKDLSQALDKIDHKMTTSKDDFDFKGTMDLLRSFTERLYRSILDQYGDEGGIIDEKDSKKVAKFFVSKQLVNIDFGAMIESQRHFISNTASHRLKSREEDARLTKNMVIEMSLYILRRLQNN